jgi:microcystin-dependent protein
MTSTLRVNASLSARHRPTTGDTKTSFVDVDHMGWLKCDGREMDIVADNLLFQVIGYTFGHGSGTKFKLPNPAGRVMGTVGTVTDDDARSRTYAKGQSVGELDHKLTIGEMPAHNHNKATASPGANTTVDGTTSVQADHIHGITDKSHAHNYVRQSGVVFPAVSATTVSVADNDNAGTFQTDGAYTGITETNPAGEHSHTISSNGGNEYHNNIQPTLFYGNTFIYCGVPMRGEFPFKTGIAPVLI